MSGGGKTWRKAKIRERGEHWIANGLYGANGNRSSLFRDPSDREPNDEHDCADDGYGDPGGDLSAGNIGQDFPEERPQRRFEELNHQPLTSRAKGPGT